MSTPRSKRTAILLAVVAGVAVIAAATCAVLAVSLGSRASAGGGVTADTQPVQERQLSPREHQKDIVDGFRGMRGPRAIASPLPPSSRPTPRTEPTTSPVQSTTPLAQPTSDGSCASEESESNVPAAHIKGHGIRRGKWIQSTAQSGSVVPGYQQRWQCNDVYVNSRHEMQEQAFVDGGVCFNQTDKSLYVPMCGYYMIYSQVLFVMEQSTLTDGVTVFHNLKIKHNCTWESDSGPIQIQAKASIAPFGTDNPDGGIATTYTANVVHLCAGGNVWIEIPDGENGVPCCPRGEDSGTFLGLVLLADTPCSSWPPVITMTHKY